MTKNKWFRALGLFLTIAALVSRGKPSHGVPWVKLSPVGLMLIVGSIGLLFLPNKIKFK